MRTPLLAAAVQPATPTANEIQRGPLVETPDDWSLQAEQVYLHGDETNRYDIDLSGMTEKSMTIRTANWDKPESGAYPDAIIRFDFAKAGNFEYLKIPIRLVVD